MTAESLYTGLVNYVINPILLLLFAAGLLVFVWGIIEFMLAQQGIGGKGSQEKIKNGKKHMLSGIIGMFIMVAAIGLVRFLANLFHVDLPRNF